MVRKGPHICVRVYMFFVWGRVGKYEWMVDKTNQPT